MAVSTQPQGWLCAAVWHEAAPRQTAEAYWSGQPPGSRLSCFRSLSRVPAAAGTCTPSSGAPSTVAWAPASPTRRPGRAQSSPSPTSCGVQQLARTRSSPCRQVPARHPGGGGGGDRHRTPQGFGGTIPACRHLQPHGLPAGRRLQERPATDAGRSLGKHAGTAGRLAAAVLTPLPHAPATAAGGSEAELSIQPGAADVHWQLQAGGVHHPAVRALTISACREAARPWGSSSGRLATGRQRGSSVQGLSCDQALHSSAAFFFSCHSSFLPFGCIWCWLRVSALDFSPQHAGVLPQARPCAA